MTILEDRPQQYADPQLETLKRRNRFLIITVVMLVVGVLALGAWVIYDVTAGSDTPTNAEIEQLLDDYNAALGPEAGEGFDVDAYRAVVTDDFVLNIFYYRQFGEQLALDSESLAFNEISLASRWHLVEASDPLVIGEGPWVASRIDHWNDPATEEPTISTYVIVDEDGTLKVVAKYAVTLGSQVE